ncbi:hypothetical protein C922_04949 [Plasmodium inui San Antonio 1]|uniref:Uncharacterized protein n=1 Tax=Plasmodium inui San Antonio 1 TaxID=1237626 RepID=W6ZZJ8_9APIC|nr:hypothetical protein C922_04949 [Plasmodium inui San Antonio 1]EUD64693.1 hypothetical protein C922_04949 [Plasmodium inui San Antonio 1]
MRGEPLRSFCATSARSQAKRKAPKYTYEDFKMENAIFFNSYANMKGIYNNRLSSSNPFDAFDVMDLPGVMDVIDVPDVMNLPDVPHHDSQDRCSPSCSKRRGVSASTCRDDREELEQHADECTSPSVESNPETAYPERAYPETTYPAPPLMEEESASLPRYTSRYSSPCLYSTNQKVHGTCFTREHTKCSIRKRRTLPECRTFKRNRRYTNYYARVQRKRRNSVFLKRKRKDAVREGALTGELNKRDITLFAGHPLKHVGTFENVSASIHGYAEAGSVHMVFHPEEAHLETVLSSEDTLEKPKREKYLAYISHSIKRQERKVRCFEKNADRMLDLVELLLYNRMKEAFFLKERICDRDKYKELCPDVFFFDNDDNLIETMDRHCRFLPKVPAKENLTIYLGPSPYSIFGEHYSTYKYFFKLVKVNIKHYRWPDPYDAANTVQNRSLKMVNCSDLLYSYKNGLDYPCETDIRRATKVDNAGKMKKRNKSLFPFLQPASTEEDKREMQNREYISVNRIPPDLIHLLNYRNVTLW